MSARNRPARGARVREPARGPSDGGQVIVFEAVMLAILIVGGVGYVTLFRDVPDSPASTALDVRLAGEDTLSVLHGLDGCAGFLDASRETACAAAHGRSALTRFLTDALAGNTTNLTLRVDTLVTGAIAWNAFLDTDGAALPVVVNGAPSGERVTTALAFAPQWNLTWLTPAQTPLAASATGGYDEAAWWALPLWKSRPLATGDDVASVRMRFPHGDDVTFRGPVVDASRGTRWTLAHWAFDEGAGTTTREARSGTDFTIDTARWVPDGREGSALRFTGEGSALARTHDAAAPPAVTLSTWVRSHTLPASDAALFSWVAGTDAVTLAQRADGTLTAVVTTPGHSTRVTSATALALESWTHVAVAVDEREARLFVNGTPVARAALPAGFSDTTPPVVTIGHDAASTYAPVDADLDRPTAVTRALVEDDWSVLRHARVPRAVSGTPGWDATTGSTRVTESTFSHNGASFTGRGTYDVTTKSALADLSSLLQKGVNASIVASGHNGTGARVVPKGEDVALEADWRPLVDALTDAGVTTANPVTTVTVRAPVTQPFESRGPGFEVVNATAGATHGFANVTVPPDWLLGAHTLVAHLDVDVTTSDGVERVRFTRVDYFHVTPPRSNAVQVDPLYRVVLELWVPEWG